MLPTDAAVPPADSFCRARRLFLSVLGAISVVAAVSYWRSFPLVCGENGVAPIEQAVASWRSVGWGFFDAPTVLWFMPTDLAIHALCALAVLAGVALVLGIAPRAAAWIGWVVQLSLFWGMQGPVFMYGWDVLLLECLFLAGFMAPSGVRPGDRWGRAAHPAAHWLLRWLLFRLLAQGVWTRLFDQWDLWVSKRQALEFGLFTQPMPTPMAMSLVEAGAGWLGMLTIGWLVADGVLALAVLGPRWARRVAAPLIVAVFACRWLLFHEGWMAPLGMGLALLLLDDRILRRSEEVATPRAGPVHSVAWAAACVFAVLSLLQWWAIGGRDPERATGVWWPLSHAQPFATCNSYPHRVGVTQRSWIVHAQAEDGGGWHPYEWKVLLGRVDRSPAWMPLHVPRFDLAVAMSPSANDKPNWLPWHSAWLRKLFEGDPAMLARFEEQPDGEPWRLRVDNFAYYPAPARSSDTWQRGREADFPFTRPFSRQDVGADGGPANDSGSGR